jgi:hypothetical protein
MIVTKITELQEKETLSPEDGVLCYDTSEGKASVVTTADMAFPATGTATDFHLLLGTDCQLFEGVNVIHEGNVSTTSFQLSPSVPNNAGIAVRNRRSDPITIVGTHTGEEIIPARGQSWFVRYDGVAYRIG